MISGRPNPILLTPAEVVRYLMRHIMIAYPQFDWMDIEIVLTAEGVLVRVATDADRGDATNGGG